MARRTVMTTAVPVVEEANIRENEVYDGVPIGQSDYEVVLEGRDKCWWQAGPVDSCFFCFSLETGVTILAGLKAVHYVIALLMSKLVFTGVKVIGTAAQKGIEVLLAKAQVEYANKCMGDPTTLSEKDCQQLEQIIQGLQDSPRWEWDLVHENLIVFFLAVGLAGGFAGLWATCGHNTLMAKLFWWSWPANFALGIIQWIVGRFTIEQQLYDHISMDKSSSTISSDFAIYYAVKCLFLAYFTKVSWSYYELLRIRGSKKEPAFGGDVELREISEESNSTIIVYGARLSSCTEQHAGSTAHPRYV